MLAVDSGLCSRSRSSSWRVPYHTIPFTVNDIPRPRPLLNAPGTVLPSINRYGFNTGKSLVPLAGQTASSLTMRDFYACNFSPTTCKEAQYTVASGPRCKRAALLEGGYARCGEFLVETKTCYRSSKDNQNYTRHHIPCMARVPRRISATPAPATHGSIRSARHGLANLSIRSNGTIAEKSANDPDLAEQRCKGPQPAKNHRYLGFAYHSDNTNRQTCPRPPTVCISCPYHLGLPGQADKIVSQARGESQKRHLIRSRSVAATTKISTG